MSWVDVNILLPEELETLCVVAGWARNPSSGKAFRYYEIARLSGSGNFYCPETGDPFLKVTHWMLIPDGEPA